MSKNAFDEIRDLLALHTQWSPEANVPVPKALLERITHNPPEGAKSKAIAFLERILSDIRDNKTLAYLVVRMEPDGEASGTHGFDGKLSKHNLDWFENACMYFVTAVQGKIKNLKKGS